MERKGRRGREGEGRGERRGIWREGEGGEQQIASASEMERATSCCGYASP